jgi:hypothetical protein
MIDKFIDAQRIDSFQLLPTEAAASQNLPAAAGESDPACRQAGTVKNET